MSELPDISELRQLIVSAAKSVNLEEFCQHQSQAKPDGSIVTALDHRMQELIASELNNLWPQFSFLGEEMDHADQLDIINNPGNGFWALDPLDGSSNFAMGFPFYGVSLALIVKGKPKIAVVYDPVRNECFSAVAGRGAFLGDKSLKTPTCDFALNECIANVDYKRLVSDLADRLVRSPPYRSQRNLGACVLEWCWLASGRVQLYIHGGQRLWDFAAGSLILEEAGGKFTSLSGNELDYQKLTKRSVIAASNSKLYELWFDWIKENSHQ